jgi:hypothetical protein
MATKRQTKPDRANEASAVNDELAIQTLRGVCRDAKAPAAAKAQAARTLLELSGALKGGAKPEAKSASEMSAGEIDLALEGFTKT